MAPKGRWAGHGVGFFFLDTSIPIFISFITGTAIHTIINMISTPSLKSHCKLGRPADIFSVTLGSVLQRSRCPQVAPSAVNQGKPGLVDGTGTDSGGALGLRDLVPEQLVVGRFNTLADPAGVVEECVVCFEDGFGGAKAR